MIDIAGGVVKQKESYIRPYLKFALTSFSKYIFIIVPHLLYNAPTK